MKLQFYLCLCLVLILSFQNCTDVQFAKVESNSGLCTTTGGQGCEDTHETLKTLQPALAVRGIACLMCHADVRANIVSDFGYGNSFYLGGSLRFDEDQSWYNNLASTWQSAKTITGTVFVPNKPVTPQAQAILGAAFAGRALLTMPEFFVTPYTVKWNEPKDPAINFSSMSLKVQPPNAQSTVKGLDQIRIRAPAEAEIQSLAPMIFLNANNSGFARVNSSNPVQFINKGSYSMNDESSILECSNADIVVKGTLFLRGLKVNAQNGCRIYASGSVFIEDAITYVGGGDKQNIQITSANAIIMGINVSRLRNRLLNDARGLEITGSRSYADRANQAVSEATTIGVLRDAQDNYGGTRASIDYSGILLNAPLVHSRYLGLVKGTIVAEAALFAIGQFHFAFDPIFSEASVFPLLQEPILIAK